MGPTVVELTPELIERGGRTCYETWTVLRNVTASWHTIGPNEQEIWREVFRAAVESLAGRIALLSPLRPHP